jgi:hypothetical protein
MRDRSGFEAVIDAMAQSPHILIRTIGRGFSQKEDKERGAVISTAQSRLEPFDSPLLQAATNHSSFKMEDLKRETLSLFIIIPPEYVAVYQPVLRLMVGLATAAMTREAKRPKHPVLFLLDELPALGHMRPIEDGIGYLAGYGAVILAVRPGPRPAAEDLRQMALDDRQLCGPAGVQRPGHANRGIALGHAWSAHRAHQKRQPIRAVPMALDGDKLQRDRG